MLAVVKGLSFLVGTVVSIVVNWVLWPFVARHELRYALSSMLFFMSVIYRSRKPDLFLVRLADGPLTNLGTVSRYVYFEEGKEPTPEDIERSEMLEGRLREGFVRIRQLLVRPNTPQTLCNSRTGPETKCIYRFSPGTKSASARPSIPCPTPPSPTPASASSSTLSPCASPPCSTRRTTSEIIRLPPRNSSGTGAMPWPLSLGTCTSWQVP